MPKILSQSGISLADMYDVQGSIAGIEQLNSEDVTLVHEMGETILSERLSGAVRRRSITPAQSVNIDETLDDLPSGISRILGVTVLVESGLQARVERLAVMIRQPIGSREIPIWMWDGTNGNGIRIEDAGAIGVFTALRTADSVFVPNLIIGDGQPALMSQITMRGSTTAFGAGTVQIILLVHLAFSQIGGGSISNIGLPVPSW